MTNPSASPASPPPAAAPASSMQRAELSSGTVALLAIGVVGVSMSGPIMAAATAVPALAMSFWRTGLGAVAMAPIALTRGRRELFAQTRRQLRLSLVAGVMLAAHFATWTSALRLTSVASATALVCLQVAWVVVLTRLSGVPVVGRVWLGLSLALGGVLLISGVDFSVSTKALTGDVLALTGGLFAAVYTMVGGRLREEISTSSYTLVCYATSAFLLLSACLVGGLQIARYDARSWLLIVAVTVAAQLLGHSVFNHLLATVSPTVVSMTLLLEVPGAALLAAVFLGQAPPVAVYVGLAVIVCGLAIVVGARPARAALTEAPAD